MGVDSCTIGLLVHTHKVNIKKYLVDSVFANRMIDIFEGCLPTRSVGCEGSDKASKTVTSDDNLLVMEMYMIVVVVDR